MEHRNLHENSLNVTKKARCGESTEDGITTEGENSSVQSKTSLKYSGVNSEYSIGTSILDAEDQDIKALKLKLEETLNKVKLLEMENKQVNSNLVAERNRTSKLEKKLQFVKDNQEVFMRLKEAYINMKYNEAAGRKMIEIREKGVQTWKGSICSACLESEDLRRQIDIMIEKYRELFVVSPEEMERIMNTVKYLKDLIDRREKSWAINMDRENKLQEHIRILENENSTLRELLANKSESLGDVQLALEEKKLSEKLLDERKVEEMQKFIECVNKDMEKLKKIVVKYEKKFREISERYPTQKNSPLNEKERKIVQQIINKYNAKLHRKSTEKVISRSVSAEKVHPQHRPSSPLRGLRDDSRRRRHEPSDRMAESAIMMMDCLFD